MRFRKPQAPETKVDECKTGFKNLNNRLAFANVSDQRAKCRSLRKRYFLHLQFIHLCLKSIRE